MHARVDAGPSRPNCAQQGETDEDAPSSPRVTAEADDDRRKRRTCQADTNQQSDLRRGEPHVCQVDRERDADKADLADRTNPAV